VPIEFSSLKTASSDSAVCRGIERHSLVDQKLPPFFAEIGVKLRQADFISKSASL
jgi:hypothetical protein